MYLWQLILIENSENCEKIVNETIFSYVNRVVVCCFFKQTTGTVSGSLQVPWSRQTEIVGAI